MLNLNTDTPIAGIWKVLVFDRVGQDIIAPLLKVNSLRQAGITVHMSINTERQPIDVPAIYFVDPTPANIAIIRNASSY